MKIIGLKKININVTKNKKGDILKFISKNNTFFRKFGEVYFSEINEKKTKGWNLHKRNYCFLTVCYGKVMFTFIDGRKKSKSYYKKDMINLDKKNYGLIIVPPGIWFSFKTKKKLSVVANCLDNPHSNNETVKNNKVNNYWIK